MKTKRAFNIPPPYFDDLSEPLNGLPTIFYVETVMACNLGCPECVIGTDNVSRKKQVMKMAEFEIISKIRLKSSSE